MKKVIYLLLLMLALSSCNVKPNLINNQYANALAQENISISDTENQSNENAIINRFDVPEGYERVTSVPGTFEYFLQHITLLPKDSPITLYNGEIRTKKLHHAAVLDYDVGKFDLMQCADSVLKLRCEYLYSLGKYDELSFSVSSDMKIDFSIWAQGNTLKPNENGKLAYLKDDENNSSYVSFLHYLNRLFTYAGTMSLYDDTKSTDLANLKIGDIFVVPGSPGHSAIIVDMALDNYGNKICLIAEGHTPAQSIHISNNLGNPDMGAWFDLNEKIILQTETFSLKNARTF